MGPDCQALPCVRRCSWWVPAVRGANRFFARMHFLVCEDVAGGSQQSGGNVFFTKYDGSNGGSQQLGGKRFFAKCWWPVQWVPAVRWRNNYFVRNKEALPCMRRYSWWVRPVSGGNVFFVKYRGPSGGSQLSGGGIIIFRVIRRHFLAAAVDPAVSLSMYSPRPMEAVP